MQDDALVAELLAIAASTGPLLERAGAVVASLHRRLGVDALRLALCDPASNVYATVQTDGPAEPVVEHLASPSADHLPPLSFRDGVSVPLREAGGPAVGTLSLLLAGSVASSDALRERLGRLVPFIAGGVSPIRSSSALASLDQDATAGVVLVRDGTTYPLTGLRDHPLLAAGSPVLAIARRMLADGQAHRVFMWPAEDLAVAGHARITLLAVNDLPSFVVGTLLIAPDADCRGLTPRELEVLGFVVEGRSNQQIARRLSLSLRTVATHLEHILHKLEVPTRTLAAVQAEREGCHVPPLPEPSAPAAHGLG